MLKVITSDTTGGLETAVNTFATGKTLVGVSVMRTDSFYTAFVNYTEAAETAEETTPTETTPSGDGEQTEG